MNKLVTLFAAAFMLASTAVWAAPSYHISFDSCGLADGDGNFVSTTDVKATFSNNGQDGNYLLKCWAKDLPNNTGGAVRYDYESTGALCTTPDFGLSTQEWFENVSTDGNAVLTCKFDFVNF